MINFVENKSVGDEKTLKIKRIVTQATTFALAIYLLVVAGLFGMWWYWSTKEKKLTDDGIRLVAQINALSSNEEIIQKLNTRAIFVKQFLDTQGNVGKDAQLAYGLGVKIDKWDFDVNGVQTLSVVVESSAQGEQVVRSLLEHYQNVSLQSLNKQKDGSFLAVISYSAYK